jgi:hypothetical protein
MSRSAFILVPLVLAAAAACSRPPAGPPPPPPPTTAATMDCAWYSPVGDGGAAVNVTAQGEGCRDGSVLRWLVADSDRRWITESDIPGSFGTETAMLTKGATAVTVWASGPAAGPLAGRIAAALQAAGWKPA